MPLKSRYLVTAALPYANGRLHIGHMAGAYLPADIFVRYLRLTGREAVFVSGSDENGVPITYAADKEGVSPTDIIDRYHPALASAFDAAGIRFSIYGRTHTPAHTAISQEWFLRLLDGGHITRQSEQQPFCRECNRFLPDRYVEGLCPHPSCAAPGARGDQCEQCGRPVDATQLGEPRCMVCAMRGKPGAGCVEIRQAENYYLELGHFQEALSAYAASHPEWRESVKRFTAGMLDQGLRSRCITRDLDWGAPVPLPEAEGKVLYVWFDAPIGYVSFTREYFASAGTPERWREFWLRDGERDAGLVHFIGKDNTVFHTLIFPGMMLGHGDYRLPDAVVANEFMNIEGGKISTSRNYAIWVDEFLRDFPADALRFYLTAIAPETSDSDFSWRQFQALHNGVLADNLGNFIQRTLAFTKKYLDGTVPEAPEASEADAIALLAKRDAARREVDERLGQFRFKEAQESVFALSRSANEFFSRAEPWKTRGTDIALCGRTLHACLGVVEALSVLLAPFLPFAAADLRRQLALPELRDNDWNAPWMLRPGHRLGEPSVLFPKLDDARMAPYMAAVSGVP